MDAVKAYAADARKKDDMDRTAEGKEKTGVKLEGVTAINPASGEEIPVWTADYVLASYGTGAVMAVPGHDERDFEFAKKYDLPIRRVVQAPADFPSDKPYTGEGIVINSEAFPWANGLLSIDAAQEIASELESRGQAKTVTKYKLRDWIFSRQRYWGEPIPMIHCEKCDWVPVPEKDLPIKLPPVKKYEPTDSGESPLAGVSSWVNTKCPTCKGKAKRETDTMPNWAGSSWYFLRYIDPKNNKALADAKKIKEWMPVDWYNGGMEHTTLHLLYSRFWHKFLFDISVVNTSEPYQKRTSHGLILAEGGVKMSKSLGNVVNPDDLVKLYGADTLRLYQLFMGPFEQAIAWNTSSMIGSRRFVERVFNLFNKVDPTSKPKKVSERVDTGVAGDNSEFESLVHKTIKKVGEDIESLAFNTAVSSLMILLNAFEKEAQEKGVLSRAHYETFLKLLAPFAPHVTDELWSMLGNNATGKKSIHTAAWPAYDAAKLQSSTFKIVVQINSKVRATMSVTDDTEASVVAEALKLDDIVKRLGDMKPSKVIYVKGKLVNFVVNGI